MRYKISKGATGCWSSIHTDFVVTQTLHALLSKCKGANVFGQSTTDRYEVRFIVSKMFSPAQVKAELRKILDAYILANPDADKAEDSDINDFAKSAEQYNFLRHYRKQ